MIRKRCLPVIRAQWAPDRFRPHMRITRPPHQPHRAPAQPETHRRHRPQQHRDPARPRSRPAHRRRRSLVRLPAPRPEACRASAATCTSIPPWSPPCTRYRRGLAPRPRHGVEPARVRARQPALPGPGRRRPRRRLRGHPHHRPLPGPRRPRRDSDRLDASPHARGRAALRHRQPRPRVHWEWSARPVVAAKRSWITEMLHLAGAENAYVDIDAESVRVSSDDAIARQPDVVVACWCGARKLPPVQRILAAAPAGQPPRHPEPPGRRVQRTCSVDPAPASHKAWSGWRQPGPPRSLIGNQNAAPRLYEVAAAPAAPVVSNRVVSGVFWNADPLGVARSPGSPSVTSRHYVVTLRTHRFRVEPATEFSLSRVLVTAAAPARARRAARSMTHS